MCATDQEKRWNMEELVDELFGTNVSYIVVVEICGMFFYLY